MPEIRFTGPEWRAAAERVAPYALDDEQVGYGHVLIHASGGAVFWAATDSVTMVLLRTECEGGDVRALVPPRVVHAAGHLGEQDADVTLTSDNGKLVLGSPATSLEIDLPGFDFPDVLDLSSSFCNRDMAAARVPVEELVGIATLAALAPAGPFPTGGPDAPTMWLEVGSGRLSLRTSWEGLGAASYSVRAECQGSASAAVSAVAFQRLVAGTRGDSATVLVPLHVHDPIGIDNGDWTGWLMPLVTGVERHRPSVEKTIADIFGPGAVLRDGDGDYPLPVGNVRAYLRLADGPPRIQVFAVVLDGVEMTEELGRELNDLNAAIAFVKVFLTEGQVLVESELGPDRFGSDELAAVCRGIERVASETAPLLASMFGGVPASSRRDGGDWRWDQYAQTIIWVETSPDVRVALNGPAAVSVLPFDAPAFVVTAWNPRGQLATAESNHRWQASLMSDLWAAGHFLLRAVGVADDGTHAEDSVCVIGMDRSEAQECGRVYGQEAVFEVTDEEVVVVACDDDRTLAVPRVTAGP
jgi:hypothetical protein